MRAGAVLPGFTPACGRLESVGITTTPLESIAPLRVDRPPWSSGPCSQSALAIREVTFKSNASPWKSRSPLRKPVEKNSHSQDRKNKFNRKRIPKELTLRFVSENVLSCGPARGLVHVLCHVRSCFSRRGRSFERCLFFPPFCVLKCTPSKFETNT